MKVNNKQYDALFYQELDMDSMTLAKDMQDFFLIFIRKRNFSNFTQKELEDIGLEYYTSKLTKKIVWFRINEHYGKYYISIYYDNEYNRANGEDL